jgi:hypothetical protein
MGYVAGYLTCCETLGTFYLACYMPLDTHNMRGKKNKIKNDCGLFEKCNVYQHIAPGKGQSNYTIEIRLLLRGAKRGKKRGKGQTWGGEIAAVLLY